MIYCADGYFSKTLFDEHGNVIQNPNDPHAPAVAGIQFEGQYPWARMNQHLTGWIENQEEKFSVIAVRK